MSQPPISGDIPSAISSLESVDGRLPCALPDGPMIDLFGQEVAPCQPYSAAGKQEGVSDERHLWPDWFRLIRECRPSTIFGEQVAGAIAFGWLDEVFNDLENEAYTCAASVLPACSVGAPHKRDRLWFVADTKSCDRRPGLCDGEPAQYGQRQPTDIGGKDIALENSEGIGRSAWKSEFKREQGGLIFTRASASCGYVGDSFSNRREPGRNDHRGDDGCIVGSAGERCSTMGNTQRTGLEGLAGNDENIGGGANPNGPATAPNPYGLRHQRTKMQRGQ